MCFNAFKNYKLGWYSAKWKSINPDYGAWSGKIAAFVDYDDTNVSNNEYVGADVAVSSDDLYLQFNRKAKFNDGTREKGDTVTIVRGSNANTPSDLVAGLGAGQSYQIDNVIVEVCEIVIDDYSSSVDYAQVNIRKSYEQSTC